jgi:TonB-linked SusC/RagA family outer membrane protein
MRRVVLIAVAVMYCLTVIAQTSRVITGRITDENNRPVSGASVIIRGTTTGTAADAEGNFRINAKTGDVLVISATNFGAHEVTVTNENSLPEIKLTRQAAVIDEVVVTALGIRRTRNEVPYAAQKVVGEEVNRTRSSNFVQNLSGKVSGLELRQSNTLGGSTNVILRGTKTISTSNQALFVIDGVPVDNSNVKSGGQAGQGVGNGGYDYGSNAADINPDDIESITVLKGAASTALYGSRGGNGVILITTKKGARGLGVTVNSGITMGKYDASTFPKYQKEYGGGYGAYYEDATGRFWYRDPNNGFVPVSSGGALVVPLSEDASYGAAFDPTLMVYHWDAFDTASPNYGKARPWVAAANDPSTFLRTAWSSNQSIMIDGGSDKGSFKLGYTRTDDWGIMPNSKLEKNLINFGATYNLTDKLTASASANFTNTKGLGRYGTGYDDKNLMTGFREWWQVNVDIAELRDAYFRHRKNVTWNWADATDQTPIYWDNPYFTRFENYSSDQRNRLIGYTSLNYKAGKNLNVLGRVSMDTYNDMYEERQARGSVATSSYSRTNGSFNEMNYDLLVNFDKDLSSDINLKALLGTNYRTSRRQLITSTTNSGLILDRIYTLSNSVNPLLPPIETDERRRVWGNFAGLTWGYQKFLTLDATIRNDRSSTLPQNNNSYWYPSTSLGFAFSNLLPATKSWLSYGKLRANYAQVGNDAQPYQTMDFYDISPAFNGVPVSTVQANKSNPNLKPERTKSWEVGLEASLFRNRLSFDVTYYNSKTFDQIFAVPVTASTGYNAKVLNAGNVRNKGVELSVNAVPVQNKNFSWNVNLNWTRNRNRVEELTPGVDNLVLGSFQGGVTLNATLGEPYGTIRGSDFVYTNGQRTINQTNGRPLVSSSSNLVIGNINPDWIGGINNMFKYKNVSLSWLIDVRQGGDVFSLDMYYGLATGLYPETAGLNARGVRSRDAVSAGGGVLLEGVAPDGKPNAVYASNSNYGLLGYERQPNRAFVYDASFVKLREAVLTYSLPRSVLGKSFKGVDLSLVGRNLLIIHKNLPYADPEEIISSGNLQGMQVGAYPAVRTFTFNVKLRF